jgi:hypothetical protein
VTIDGAVALIQPHAQAILCLCPLAGMPQPLESVAWYYADCIAYEHDIPVIVLPTRGDFDRFGYRYALEDARPQQAFIVRHGRGRTTKRIIPGRSRKRDVKDFYADQLCSILEEVRGLRHGPLTFVSFRHRDIDARIDLPYLSKYAGAAQEIHLYAVALRQVDALGEFLNYYRVIESATGSNGKTWVAAALDRLQTHDFGGILITHDLAFRTRNLLSIWKRRALRRLSTLQKEHGSSSTIAKYLYNVNRCGIAHGTNIVKADITLSYFNVVRDAYVLKLLARLAIDEKL